MVYAYICSVKCSEEYHEYKDVWSTFIDRTELPRERESGNPRDTSAIVVIE